MLTRAATAAAATALGASALVAAAPPASAAAAGPFDFNGDGYRDLAIGSPNGKVGTKKQAGFVSVIYGSAKGLNTSKKKVYSQDTAGVPGAAEASDHWGYALASGDLDKDGYADLVVTAPDEDAAGKSNVGVFTILWGSRSGLKEASEFYGTSAAAGDRFGLTVAVGDFDGRGYADLAFTSARFWGWFGGEETSASATRGHFTKQHRMTTGRLRAAAASTLTAAVYSNGDITGDGVTDVVLTWRNTADTDPVYRSALCVFVKGSEGALAPASCIGAELGPVAIGNFTGDRYADVAVGQSGDAGHKGGRVAILTGGPDGVSTARRTFITQETPGVPGSSATGDRFGAALDASEPTKYAGPVLAIGAPGKKVGSAGAGAVYIFSDSSGGAIAGNAELVTQNTAGVPGTAEKNDHFGAQVAILNHDNIPYADVNIGAPGENANEGAVTYLKGRPAGVRPVSGALAITPATFGVTKRNAQLGIRLGT